MVDVVNNLSNERTDWSNLGAAIILAATFTCDYNSSPMLMSFFPQVTSTRGFSPTQNGIIFAAYGLGSLISNIYTPSLTRIYNSVNLLYISTAALALITEVFSFTHMVKNNGSFFSACLTLRVLQGLIAGTIEVTSVGIMMRNVPGAYAGSIVGWVQGVRALATITSPVASAFFFTKTGYFAPFLFSSLVTAIVAISMIASGLILKFDKNVQKGDGNWSTLKLLKKPVVFMILVAYMILGATISFLEPTLETFLSDEPYSLTNVQVGLVYTFSVISFALFSVVSGEIAGKVGDLNMVFWGLIITGLSYCFIAPPKEFAGPLSIFSFAYTETGKVQVVLVSMLVGGIGAGSCISPLTNLLINEAKESGLSVDRSSDSIASIMALGFCVGTSAGPLLNGVLVQYMGFKKSCTLFGFILIAVDLYLMAFIKCFKMFCQHFDTTEESILRPEDGSPSLSLINHQSVVFDPPEEYILGPGNDRS